MSMEFFGKRLCFVGAHPDDIELGCGAFISQVHSKTDIICVTLSDNQENPQLNNLVAEHYNSMTLLGVPRERIRLEAFTTRKFPDSRQEILEYLYQVNKEYRPDIVFVHTRSDIHQDHQTTTDEVLRAFRGVTALGFDVIRSSYGFFPHFLVEVTEEDVERKLAALAEYKTYNEKYYFGPELLRSIMIRHGSLAECHYAEGFDILRVVGKFRAG